MMLAGRLQSCVFEYIPKCILQHKFRNRFGSVLDGVLQCVLMS